MASAFPGPAPDDLESHLGFRQMLAVCTINADSWSKIG